MPRRRFDPRPDEIFEFIMRSFLGYGGAVFVATFASDLFDMVHFSLELG